MEFWFALIKVATLVVFMVIGIFLLVTQHDGRRRRPPARQLITDNGGIFPQRHAARWCWSCRAWSSRTPRVELVGVAAGETANPEKIMPRAINSIMWRDRHLLRRLGRPAGAAPAVARAYSADESPFVTVLSQASASRRRAT